MDIKTKKLTSDDFMQYGQVISIPTSLLPTIKNEEITYWKQQAVLDIDGPIEIGILKVKKHEMVFSQMEKHLKTPEMLIGLDGAFIIPVTSMFKEKPEVKKIEAFEVAICQAIIMSPHCWHWTPCPVDKSEITILVIFKDNTSQNDIVIKDLDQECKIV